MFTISFEKKEAFNHSLSQPYFHISDSNYNEQSQNHRMLWTGRDL